MPYYGFKRYPDFIVLRNSLPVNQTITPRSADEDLIYRSQDGATVTVAECAANASLIGTTFSPNSIAYPKQLFGNLPCALQVTGNNATSISLRLNNRQQNLSNVELVSVDFSYTLPAGKYALIVEGELTIPGSNGNATVTADEDIYVVGSKPRDILISGNGKIVTFNIQ